MSLNSKNPWALLEQPTVAGELTAIRVDPSSSWAFFWSLSHENQPQLTLLHQPCRLGKLPTFDGFRVTSTPNSDGRRILSFILDDETSLDVFHALCIDLVAATNNYSDEETAVKESLNRAWSWHRLLQGKRDGKLSDIEQQGLFGELYVIAQALDSHDALEVISSWKAPEDNAKDFIHNSNAIEVKSRRSAHSSSVRVTSAEQLDGLNFDTIVLAVVTLAMHQSQGTDLHSYSRSIISRLVGASAEAAALFEQKIVQRGLWPEHNYSNDLWSIISVDFYTVGMEFPRIQSSELAPGLNSVTYSIDLNTIKPFAMSESEAIDRLYLSGE